jgi:hypothetical protein
MADIKDNYFAVNVQDRDGVKALNTRAHAAYVAKATRAQAKLRSSGVDTSAPFRQPVIIQAFRDAKGQVR